MANNEVRYGRCATVFGMCDSLVERRKARALVGISAYSPPAGMNLVCQSNRNEWSTQGLSFRIFFWKFEGRGVMMANFEYSEKRELNTPSHSVV